MNIAFKEFRIETLIAQRPTQISKQVFLRTQNWLRH